MDAIGNSPGPSGKSWTVAETERIQNGWKKKLEKIKKCIKDKRKEKK